MRVCVCVCVLGCMYAVCLYVLGVCMRLYVLCEGCMCMCVRVCVRVYLCVFVC